MARTVMDSNVGESDFDLVLNSIISQNPQLNAQIKEVRESSNIFLCEVLRIYYYEDKALVKILNTGDNVFCRLSHEMLGGGMSVDYLPSGVEKTDDKYLVGKKYVRPYSKLFGVVANVRWMGVSDENVLLQYVNIYDKNDLKSNSNKGELNIRSGSSSVSLTNERVNIMTPALFINGLPFDEPNLKNYYNKTEMDLITNSLIDLIKNNTAQKSDSCFTYEELAEATEYYNKKSSNKYTLFRGDCWTINSNFESSASITSTNNTGFTVTGTFRTDSDMVGIYWNSKDLIEHHYISYGSRYDYKNVKLEFDYSMTGCREWSDDYNDTSNPCVITINKKDGSIYYLVMNQFINNGHVTIDFNNLKLQNGNVYINHNGQSVEVHEETKISVNDIDSIMLMLKPSLDNGNYNIIENVDFNCVVSNITVTNGDICYEHLSLEPHQYRLCEGYDDFYNFNPKRIAKEMRKLGYTGWCDLYIGASHYYEKSGTPDDVITDLTFNHNRTEKMVLNPNVPVNKAFEKWLDCYARELKNNGTDKLIISVSMENLQCPSSWRQKTSSGDDAITGWIPSTFFYSPCNSEPLEFMKTVSEKCLDILVDNNMRPILQLGEAWWWWNENDYPNQPPCFYDDATKTKYYNEFGKDIPVYTNSWTKQFSVPMMLWLNKQLVNYSKELKKVVKKSKYKNGLYMALFFPPSVMDEDRVPLMIQKVNYLSGIYNPSHVDILQIEDYDWTTGRPNVSETERKKDLSHHPKAYTIGGELGFDVKKQHYFGGFVQYEENAIEYWKLIKKAMNDAINKGFAEVFVWAGSQVRRDKKIIGHDVYELVQQLKN